MGYSDLVCTNKNLIYLTTAALSNPNSLTLSLTLPLVWKSDYIQDLTFYALVDSESIYYFIDSIFVLKHNVFTKPTPPIKLNYLTDYQIIPLSKPLLHSETRWSWMYMLFCSTSPAHLYLDTTGSFNIIQQLTWLLGLSLSDWTYEKETTSLKTTISENSLSNAPVSSSEPATTSHLHIAIIGA